MKLVSLTLPDEPAALPDWLERQLVGPNLGRLVAELQLIHKPTGPTPAIDVLLGDSTQQVFQHGLSALPRSRLTTLLQNPLALVTLQELVLIQGGKHWQNLLTSDADSFIENGLNRVRPSWSLPTPSQSGRTWYSQPAIVSFATAVAVLLSVFAVNHFRTGEPGPVQIEAKAGGIGWGWAKAGAIPEGGTARDYLYRLADGADQWPRKRPDEAAALAQRINEFRAGCTMLVFATHAPLPAADKKWLVDRCRIWGERLDKQLEAVEAGRPVGEVRDAVDEIARQIVAALKARADVFV